MSQLKIFWTTESKVDMRLIKRYYIDAASIGVAEKIFQSITVIAEILKTHPDAGQEEDTLKPLKEGHRYLVKGNYKIIYKKSDKGIFITAVFDTRQNPKKLLKGKK